ncbi:MAG: pitrilysin family protein [Polyangiaceae bacterium]
MTDAARYQEAVIEEVNRGRSASAHFRHVGAHSLGPGMVIERYRLANGLDVLVHVDDAAPVVALQTWFRVGSRFEKPGKTGIAHLFEHLMFGETEEHPHGAFDRLLEEAGAETNAATFVDWTYYQQNLPKDALELGLKLEASRIARLVLREPQVKSEKEVVANERRQRVDDDVDGAVSEVLYREAFRSHAYGIPTIGLMADILSFTPADCVEFYRTYYAPNNATLVLVGDVALPQALGWIADSFGQLLPSEIPPEDVHPEPPQTEERRLEVAKPTLTEKIALGYKGPCLGDYDHAALTVLNEILFGGRAGRVHKRLVKTKEIASDVRGWVATFRDPGLYEMGATAREGHTAEELIAELDAELDLVLAGPVAKAELERAKSRLELGTVQSLETVGGKAETIGFYDTVLGDPGALFLKLDAYRRVTRDDVLRVARRFLISSARTLVIVRSSGELPEGEDDGEEDEAAQ